MMKLLMVGTGGFLGALMRYLTNQWVLKLAPSSFFPYATFTVNFVGCLLFGILMGVVEQKQNISPEISLFLLVGFLGGLTTFSNYAYESFQLIRNQHFLMAIFNVMAQTGFGLLAVTVGYFVAVK